MEQSINRKGSSFFQLAIRIMISTGLIAWLLYTIEWGKALQVIKEGSPFYFASAFIVIQITVFSSVWKWKSLVHSAIKDGNKQEPSFSKLGRLYYIGLFFNHFLPGSVGGDFVRILYLGRTIGMPQSTASVAFERLTSGVAMIVIVLVASLFMESVRPFLVTIYIVAAIFIGLFFLIGYWIKKGKRDKQQKNAQPVGKWIGILNKGKNTVASIGETAADYRNESWKWWLWIAILSLFFQVGMAWINDLLFLGLGINVSWYELLVFITLISVITMLPISINGIGVREASYLLFFKELGVPDEIAVFVSLLFFVLVAISSLAGGVFWLVERRKTE